MNFFKPKFWDKNKISFFSVLLYPSSLTIKILSFLKKYFVRTNNFKIPIICVGNIYLGGTGKTPFCIELFFILEKFNKKPGFIRKKYKSFRDEITLLKQVGEVYENKNRSKAIKVAIQDNRDILILDDGFQDLSVKKDLSIICFNEKQWIGNGFTIPSGPLREGLSSLKRANYVIINGKKNTNIEKKIFEKNNKIKIFYTAHIPININEFKNKKIMAFAGIGNTNNFFSMLIENKINIIEEFTFPDHYHYSEKDLEKLLYKARDSNATLVTTEKDYLRIDDKFRKNISFLKIKTEIENKNYFINEIKNFI